MQYNFDCEQILGCDNQGFALLEGTYQDAIKPAYLFYVHEILNSIGEMSAKSRNLSMIPTSAFKFFNSSHRICIRARGNSIIGFVKVGVKKMMVKDQNSNFYESSPLTLLDFYVHQSEQIRGHGKALLDKLLQFERLDASKIAYDQPTEALLHFLRKNYNVGNVVPQNSNFIVFPGFFEINNNNPMPMFLNRQVRKPESRDNHNNSNNSINLNNNNNLSNVDNTNNVPQQSPNNSLIKANFINDSKKKLEMEGGLYRPNYIVPHSTDKGNSSPLKGFHNRIFNRGEANNNSEVFTSKRDFYDNINPATLGRNEDIRYKYVQEKLNNTETNTEKCKARLRDIEKNIDQTKLQFNDYYRRNEYSTIWDDKKSLEHSHDFSNDYRNNNRNFITNRQYERSVLPTTSSNYGLHTIINK